MREAVREPTFFRAALSCEEDDISSWDASRYEKFNFGTFLAKNLADVN